MGEAFSAEATGVTKSTGGISWAGAGHRCGRGEPGGASGTGVLGTALGTARSLPDYPLHPAMLGSHHAQADVGRGEVGLRTPGQTAPRPRLRPQLPPDERGVLVPAGLGGPPLQRELPAGHARAGLPGALPLPSRRRLPARQRPLPVRARLHGEASPTAREVRKRLRESARPSHECAHPPPHFQGPHCASLCPPDTYGVNCSQRCSCENAIACSPIDGTCVCKEGTGLRSPGRTIWGRGHGKKGESKCRGRPRVGERLQDRGGITGQQLDGGKVARLLPSWNIHFAFVSTTKIPIVLKGPGQRHLFAEHSSSSVIQNHRMPVPGDLPGVARWQSLGLVKHVLFH